jgi:hypothetical protein
MHNTMQYSMQYSIIRCCIIHYVTVHCNSYRVYSTTEYYGRVRHGTALFITVDYSVVKCSTVHCILVYRTVYCGIVPYGNVQSSTLQFLTVADRKQLKTVMDITIQYRALRKYCPFLAELSSLQNSPFSPLLFRTIPLSAVKYSTLEYSKVRLCPV